jgi:hypothetical protein
MSAEYKPVFDVQTSANDSALADASPDNSTLALPAFPSHHFRIMIRANPAARSCKDWPGALRRAMYKEVVHFVLNLRVSLSTVPPCPSSTTSFQW